MSGHIKGKKLKIGLLLLFALLFMIYRFTPVSHYIFSSSKEIVGQFEFPFITEVYSPPTGLIDPPTVIGHASLNPTDVAKLKNGRPASMILQLSDDLTVSNSDDASLIHVLSKMKKKVIPIFWIEDVHVAVQFIDFYLDEKNLINDGMVMSSNPSILESLRIHTKYLPGILMVDGSGIITKQKRDYWLSETLAHLGRVLYIKNAQTLTHDDLLAIQSHGVNVWLDAFADPFMYDCFVKGPDGLVTDQASQIYKLYTAFDSVIPIMLKPPLNVAHRGLPALVPQNTLEGAVKAFDYGADCVELDIMMTADGVLVNFHDDKVGALTGDKKNRYIWDLTFEEVQQLVPNQPGSYAHAVKWDPGDYTHIKIPTIRSYLETFKDPLGQKLIFAEIKDVNDERYNKILIELNKLLEEFDMFEQVVLINFDYSITKFEALRQHVPQLSVGALTRKATTPQNLMRTYVPFNMFINGRKHGAISKEVVMALNHRGVAYASWTYRFFDERFPIRLFTQQTNRQHIMRDYVKGFYAMTTSNANEMAKTAVKLIPEQKNAVIKKGATFTPAAETENRLKERKKAVLAPPIILEGADIIAISPNGVITGTKPGVAKVVYLGKATILQKDFYLLSDVITIQVVAS